MEDPPPLAFSGNFPALLSTFGLFPDSFWSLSERLFGLLQRLFRTTFAFLFPKHKVTP